MFDSLPDQYYLHRRYMSIRGPLTMELFFPGFPLTSLTDWYRWKCRRLGVVQGKVIPFRCSNFFAYLALLIIPMFPVTRYAMKAALFTFIFPSALWSFSSKIFVSKLSVWPLRTLTVTLRSSPWSPNSAATSLLMYVLLLALSCAIINTSVTFLSATYSLLFFLCALLLCAISPVTPVWTPLRGISNWSFFCFILMDLLGLTIVAVTPIAVSCNLRPPLCFTM